MLPKPKFDLNPRPTSVNSSPAPQTGRTWFQYNPSQTLNQPFVSNSPNYGQNYSNQSRQTLNNNFSPVWYQNNFNSNNVNNVWNGFNNQNNVRFNQNYGKPQHYHRNEYQNKRFKDNNNNNNFNTNSNSNSNGSKKSFNCDTCCRWFQTEDLYNQHISEHILCGLDECKFKAHPKVIESHQRMQHFCFKDRTVVKKFMNLETEEDIEKWKEERKRNFPTKDNIKKKQEIIEKQRLEAIEEKNRLKQIEDKRKEVNEKQIKGNDKTSDQKSKKNRKSSKGKGRPKLMNTCNRNRRLTLFQKLMMNEIQEENEQKVTEKVENSLRED